MMHEIFARFVFALDRALRRRYGIFEYCHDPDCVFRAAVVSFSGKEHRLADGLMMRKGDEVVELHLWNEQVPLLGVDSSMAWALSMGRGMTRSLRCLAKQMDDPLFSRAVAVRMEMNVASDADKAKQLERIMQRLGFEVGHDDAAPSAFRSIRHLGENILVTMLVAARNPSALRWNTFRRVHQTVEMSRAALLDRYFPRTSAGE